jgi:hypothetical protein
MTMEPDAEHRDSFDRLAAEVGQTVANMQQKLQKQPADHHEDNVQPMLEGAHELVFDSA